MRYLGPSAGNLRLPHVLVPAQVCRRIQAGGARSVIVPFLPALFASFEDARQAFHLGLMRPPIPRGYAFEVMGEIVPGRVQKIGTGIVGNSDLTALEYITDYHLGHAGYASLDELKTFWHQLSGDLDGLPDPWCWIIEFVFKG